MLTLDTIGKDLVFNVTDEDIAKLLSYESVKERIVRIGLSNILKDCHATITRDECESDEQWKADSMAMVQKSFDAMCAGEVRKISGKAKTPKDPIGVEAARLGRVYVGTRTTDAQLAKWSLSFAETLGDEFNGKSSADQRKAVIGEAIRRYAARPETIAEATANVAKLSETVAVDVDL